MAGDKKKLIRLQDDDSTPKRFKKAKGTETRKGYVISYEKLGGIRYRICQQKDKVKETRKQILGPKLLKESNGDVSRFFVWLTKKRIIGRKQISFGQDCTIMLQQLNFSRELRSICFNGTHCAS